MRTCTLSSIVFVAALMIGSVLVCFAAEPALVDKLKQLKEAKDAGLISADECATKRQQLLDSFSNAPAPTPAAPSTPAGPTKEASDARNLPTSLTVTESKGSGDYCIIDVSGGPSASSYPVMYQAAAPPLNDAHKTSKIVLRRIPAGSFVMGAPANEPHRSTREGPQHTVNLTTPFYMGVFEITQAQYANVMGFNPSQGPGPKRPVERVSWYMVRGGKWPGGTPATSTFADKLRSKTGLAFDLPTEAQWEYACRAGTAKALNNNTDVPPHGRGRDSMKSLGRCDETGGTINQMHTSVGSYLPNTWGLYDMHGNVAEQCLDFYDSGSDDGYQSGPATDPVGPLSGNRRVIRGGAYDNSPECCRSASRFWFPESDERTSDSSVGFRLILPAGRNATVASGLHVTCPASALRYAVQLLCPVWPTNTYVPVLTNLHVLAERSSLQLTVTGLDISTWIRIPVNVLAVGETTMPAKLLLDTLNRISTGTVDLSVDMNHVTTIRLGGKVHCSLRGMAPVDVFPKYTVIAGGDTIEMAAKELGDMIRQTSYAVSRDKSRGELNGWCFHFGEQLDVVAMDGWRIAKSTSANVKHSKQPSRSWSMQNEYIIPTRAIGIMQTMLAGDSTVKLRDNFFNLEATMGSTTLVMTSIPGHYPRYDELIPERNSNTPRVAVNRKAFLDAVVAVTRKATPAVVRVVVKEGTLTVSASTAENARVESALNVKYTGKPVDMIFQATFLTDVCQYMGTEEIVIEFSNSTSPVVIRSGGNVLCVIMPMKP